MWVLAALVLAVSGSYVIRSFGDDDAQQGDTSPEALGRATALS